jgi:MoaA/NifB/PqqE/SkfB family radical SAM enzyme
MATWLQRARTSLTRTRRALTPRPASAYASRKIDAIASYAEFCRGGAFPAYPLEMFLEISNLCDLKCAMCVQFSALNARRFESLRATDRGFFEMEAISDHLEDALAHALVVHCFGYGEPTLHPQFRSLVEFLAGFEVQIDFFTNGMHLDDALCDFLVDSKVHQVTISFSGATAEAYENIYLGGDFQRVLGGMSRLDAVKKARRSPYPIIEVNSLAFRDHVQAFEPFVELMAAHGANVVHLKKLQHHKQIPQLYEHASVMRPGVDDVIVRRAVDRGAQLGVQVSADLYLARGAADEADYARRVDELKAAAEQNRGEHDRPFGENPVTSFKDIARGVVMVRDRGDKTPAPVLNLDADDEDARSRLDVRRPPGAEGAPAFHCMEPYKTLYVTRNGPAKPCCFASPAAGFLGDVEADDAVDVWRGAGFATVREAIAVGEYPMKNCGTCLRNKSGPRGHFAAQLINRYLDWQARAFASPLRARLAARDATAVAAIRDVTGPDIMALRQAREPASVL